MTTDREKLLDRILKLHRKAESAREIGSEAEAMIFADAVQKMLLKHDLELSEVEYQAELKEDPVKMHHVPIRGKKRQTLWTTVLVNGIAKGHLCAVIGLPKSDGVLLVGRRHHRQVAEFMIRTLIPLAEKLADKAYTQYFYECLAQGDVTAARGYRDSFLTGFASRVHARYEGLMRETAQSKQPGALIRLSQEKALIQQLFKELEEKDAIGDAKGGPAFDIENTNLMGFAHGHEAGDRVGLKANAVAAGQPAPKSRQLGAGLRQLSPGEG